VHKEDNPDVVLVKCPLTPGNPDGFYRLNRTEFTEGMVVFGDTVKPVEDMTVAELKAKLAETGMDVPEHAKKADLVALCLSLDS